MIIFFNNWCKLQLILHINLKLLPFILLFQPEYTDLSGYMSLVCLLEVDTTLNTCIAPYINLIKDYIGHYMNYILPLIL